MASVNTDHMMGIEETRKYKTLVNSLYELQDWFHQTYPDYKMLVDLNHDMPNGLIIVSIKWFFESYSLGQRFALPGEVWNSPFAIDKMARTFVSDEYKDTLKRAIANKIIVGPDEVRRYEDAAEAYEIEQYHDMPEGVQ